jgi:signal transduction histidine kinase
VNTVAVRLARLQQPVAARLAALPPRYQELIQDTGLGVSLATVNVVSLLPYRDQLHPLWLALVLAAGQALPLAFRRFRPVGVGLVIGAARVAYDKIGFGFAPFPLGPAIAFYTIMDRRGAVWRWVACLLVVAGISISEASPGHAQPYDTIFQVMIFFTAAAAGLLSRAKRASIQAAQSRADRAEAELDRQSAQAAEQERTRIARELHDVVAHSMSVIHMQATSASYRIKDIDPESKAEFARIAAGARSTMREMRQLLTVLRDESTDPALAPVPGLAGLADLAESTRLAGVPVELRMASVPEVPDTVGAAAYRIVQESLSNVIRHAPGARCVVDVSTADGMVDLLVTNGPSGSAPMAEPDGTGHGLHGMRERVRLLGGSLETGPCDGGGYRVAARLPVGGEA